MRAGEREGGVNRGLPETGDDLELLRQPLEASPELREANPVGSVLLGVPASAEPELDTTPAHLIDLCDCDGEGSREAEGGRGDQRAQPDSRCLSGEASQGDPRVGRAWQAGGVPHLEEVVRTEERVEPLLFGDSCDRQLIVVGGPLLGFEEDAELHGAQSGPTQEVVLIDAAPRAALSWPARRRPGRCGAAATCQPAWRGGCHRPTAW